MNMKKLVFILIGLVLISFGVGFLSLSLSGNYSVNINRPKNHSVSINKSNVNNGKGEYKKIDDKDKVPLDRIEEIDVNADIATISIVSEDREDISLHYYGTVSDHIKTDLSKRIAGKKLIVEAKAQNNISKSLNSSTKADLHLDIVIPSSYSNDFSLKANLGSANIEGLELNKIYVRGELGGISIKNAKFKELDIKSSLGKIYMDNVEAEKNKVKTDLGSIGINNVKGALRAKTNLGSINLNYDKINWDIRAESSSGSITIVLPKNSNFTIDARTDLGNIGANIPLDIKEKSKTKLSGKSGNGENSISLIADLGSIIIKEK